MGGNHLFVNQALPNKASRKKYVIAVIIIILLVAGAITAFIIYNHSKTEAYDTYTENLHAAKDAMMEGVNKSKSLGQLTLQVWNNSINNKKAPETEKYTKDVKDFNVALTNLYNDNSTQAIMDDINSNQTNVANIMATLKEPPAKELNNDYAAVIDLYGKYKEHITLVMNPTGSYGSFNRSFTNVNNHFLDSYRKLDALLSEENSK